MCARSGGPPNVAFCGTAIDSPWVTTSSNTNFPQMTRKKEHWFFHATLLYKRRRPLPHHTPITCLWHPSPYLKSPPRSRNFFQTNLLALLESLIGCYKLETLNFSPSSYYSLLYVDDLALMSICPKRTYENLRASVPPPVIWVRGEIKSRSTRYRINDISLVW